MKNQISFRSLTLSCTLAALATSAFAAPPPTKEAGLRSSLERSGGTLEEVLDFEIVAELKLGNGTVHFIDETVDGVFGLGILELGHVDLGPFYEEEATALEIYLALAPKNASIPDALYRAHELARTRNSKISEIPRDFSDLSRPPSGANKSVTYQNWLEDTTICWNWGTDSGSLSGAVAGAIGDPGYNYPLARSGFRTWSQVPNSFHTTENDVDRSANSVSPSVYVGVAETPFGNERALGVCVTHAELSAGTGWWDCNPAGNEENSVRLRVRLKGESATRTWYSSQSHLLTDYGQGARYRSESSENRRYTIEARDDSIRSNGCQEYFHAMTRSRDTFVILPGPGDVTGG